MTSCYPSVVWQVALEQLYEGFVHWQRRLVAMDAIAGMQFVVCLLVVLLALQYSSL